MFGFSAKSKQWVILFTAFTLLCGCMQTQFANESLRSLRKIDDFPLYTMVYENEYVSFPGFNNAPLTKQAPHSENQGISLLNYPWGCSLFAALGDPQYLIYGRNFDWQFSPALLLFVKPTDGFSSVSMVDIAYLGYQGERSKKLLELSADELQPLLDAPSLPFDGMNEKGLAVGMAAVSPGDMKDDPEKPNIDSLEVIREILDHAANVEEALNIIDDYDIDFGTGPALHYLIADKSGKAALVEYYHGKIDIQYNENPWHLATNFIVTSVGEDTEGICHRYDKIMSIMKENQGELSSSQAMTLLEDISSADLNTSTQWSVIYGISSGDIWVVMGRDYEKVYTFNINEW